MTEQEALAKMVAPGTRRPGKYREGVIQVHVTRACDKACFGCTQGSNLRGSPHHISLEHFEQAVRSLDGYFGVVGMFGGNPAVHPRFTDLCAILRALVPYEQRGLWSNNPITEANARAMRDTFNPAVSNLNVHLDRRAFDLFRAHWPESRPFGLHEDSRHSPPYVAMKDLDRLPVYHGQDRRWFTSAPNTEENRLDLIADCDINKHWSAMLCVVRGQLRAYFCEIAGAQAMLHEDNPDWPDTGLLISHKPEGCPEHLGRVCDYCGGSGRISDLKPAVIIHNQLTAENTRCPYCRGGYVYDEERDYPAHPALNKANIFQQYGRPWWQLPMEIFASQVRQHCHACGVPLRGYGELAQSPDGVEQVSATHADIYSPKKILRAVQVVKELGQLGIGRLQRFTDYMENSKR